MIQIITNNIESGDWVLVKAQNGEVLHSGHTITPFDLLMILQNLGHHAEEVSVTDEQMEGLL